YMSPAVRIRGRAMRTNTPPNGAFRGFGAPQAFFGIESHMERIGDRLGIPSHQIREINRLRDGDILPTGEETCEGKRVQAVFERAMEVSGFIGKKQEFEDYNRQTPWRKKGIGMALFFHGSGFTGKGEERISAVVELAVVSGPQVEIRVSSTEMGQGEMTVLRQIAADSLGIPMAMVITSPVSTALVPNTGPTVASRTTMMAGGLVRKAAERMRHALGEDILSGLRERRGFTVREQYIAPPDIIWDDDRLEGKAYPAYSWACYAAEVEVCLQTYRVFPQKVWAVHDIGRVVNPLLAGGQVEGESRRG
ncbi:MAG: molybdopterin-dependent oxidoreductase, partial [Nitrospirales bacterium]|nr:molybdopterin-dependent oxidoreductase [Nitrospirales bacterium]